MNPALLHAEIQHFITAHLNDDLSRILLGKSPFENVSSRELAEQIDSKKRSEKKLPTWFEAKGIYYPTKLSVEQSSSEATANYKSKLIIGDRVLDMTGGLGVDCFYFAKKAKEVVHIEQSEELSQIAAHNSGVLGAENCLFLNGDSINFLEGSSQTFDTIFVDPARRSGSGKVFKLKDCEPDITAALDLLLRKAKRLIVKTSPLLDISSGLRELRNVSEIHVVSVKNDCKELLWIMDRSFDGEPRIFCSALDDVETSTLSFKISEEKELEPGPFMTPLSFLYEPDVALLKAGCFKLITRFYPLGKLHINSHLYTSDQLVDDFIGRTFKVVENQAYKDFTGQKIKRKANIIVRNFPLTPEELKKKHKVEDGGADYLIFTTGPSGELLVVSAVRI